MAPSSLSMLPATRGSKSLRSAATSCRLASKVVTVLSAAEIMLKSLDELAVGKPPLTRILPASSSEMPKLLLGTLATTVTDSSVGS